MQRSTWIPCVCPLPPSTTTAVYSRSSVQIELTAEDLYDKDKVDLETIVIEDVFKLLQCNEEGLTSAEASRRLELFGPNKLESEDQNPILQVRLPLPTAGKL